MMKVIPVIALGALMLLSTGCVTKSTHEATLQELNSTREALGSAQQTIEAQRQEIAKNKEEIARNEAEIERNRKEIEKGKEQITLNSDELAALELKKKALQQELDDARHRLEASQLRLNTTEARLNTTESQLETMRQIEAETQKRNEIYARFVKELQKMIDGGQLTVSIEQGRIVINLPDNVLFASGSATVNSEGQAALGQIAEVIKAFSDRRFQVEGHTDNVPIKSARFPSNWELSTARALSVVHLMIEKGVSPENVSAAGFGEFQPRADNDTEEGKALNRRIEIIMLPNLEILSDELPKVAR